jgi:hypothetical protein
MPSARRLAVRRNALASIPVCRPAHVAPRWLVVSAGHSRRLMSTQEVGRIDCLADKVKGTISGNGKNLWSADASNADGGGLRPPHSHFRPGNPASWGTFSTCPGTRKSCAFFWGTDFHDALFQVPRSGASRTRRSQAELGNEASAGVLPRIVVANAAMVPRRGRWDRSHGDRTCRS